MTTMTNPLQQLETVFQAFTDLIFTSPTGSGTGSYFLLQEANTLKQATIKAIPAFDNDKNDVFISLFFLESIKNKKAWSKTKPSFVILFIQLIIII